MELMETSERPFVAVGGYNSLRSYYTGRFTGPGKLIGGLEARYAVLLVPSLVEVKLVAFYDAGRVFGPGEGVRLTAPGLPGAGGAELAARLLRNSLLVMGYGQGSDGGRFLLGTSWSYCPATGDPAGNSDTISRSVDSPLSFAYHRRISGY